MGENLAPAVGALGELAAAADADWRVYPVPEVNGWAGELTWPHTQMSAHPDAYLGGLPTVAAACNALAEQLLIGQVCPACSHIVLAEVLADGDPAGTEVAGADGKPVCRWRLDGAHWTPSCPAAAQYRPADLVTAVMVNIRAAGAGGGLLSGPGSPE